MSDEFGIDLTLLQVLRRRDRFETLSSAVPMDALDPTVKALLQGYAGFFQSMPGVPLLKPAEFWTFYASGPARGLKGDALQLHKAVLKRALAETVEPAVEDGIMTRLVSLATADVASKAAAEYAEGKEVDVAEVLRAAVDRSDQLLAQAAKDPQERTPIEEILAKEENDWGFTHILPSLNASLRPMTPGENIVIAARVNVGKSTYVAQQAVQMAREVDKLWPGEDRSVLWLVNEGTADKMVQRAFQTALRMTPEEMFAEVKLPSSTHRNRLVELYAKALNGRPGALRVFNAHGMGPGDIMRLVRRYRAGAVIADMVAHLTPPPGGGDMRTDQKLESLWQWFRDAGARHDFVTVGTAQLSADAAGVQWPEMHMMHNVKTGVQGALDTMIAIGMLNDPMMRRFRYVGVPKFKRGRTGVAPPRIEVVIDGDRAHYHEPQSTSDEEA